MSKQDKLAIFEIRSTMLINGISIISALMTGFAILASITN